MKRPRNVMEKFNLPGRHALVTGGTCGIGKAITVGLMQTGANVIATRTSRDKVDDRFERELQELGLALPLILEGDVADETDVERMLDQAQQHAGHISVLVNNAGINLTGAIETYAKDDFDRLMSVNVTGMFLCCKHVGKNMIENGGGSIINVGLINGEVVNVPIKQTPYGASKAAMNIFSKCIAAEWAEHGIRANVIAPGFTATDMVNERLAKNPDPNDIWLSGVPLDRIAEPEEIAGAVVCLAWDASSYITGSVVTVDGGYTVL